MPAAKVNNAKMLHLLWVFKLKRRRKWRREGGGKRVKRDGDGEVRRYGEVRGDGEEVPLASSEAAMVVKCYWFHFRSLGIWESVLFLVISSSHWRCLFIILVIAELTGGHRWSWNLEPDFCPCEDLEQPNLSSVLTAMPSSAKWHSG